MDISRLFIIIIVVAVRFELVTCNLDLKCKAREGCHFSGCDPMPFSPSSFERNEFPITCLGNSTSVQREMEDLKKSRDNMRVFATQLEHNDKEMSKEIKRLTYQVSNLTQKNTELRKARASDLARLVQLEQKLEKLISISISKPTVAYPTASLRRRSAAISRQRETYSSCSDVNLESAKSQNKTGGVFDIAIPGVGTKEVYCTTEIDGGDWIVFQRRMDGSVDFYLNWNDYVTGFGTARGEYWLGLEAIYQLTKNGNVELRIDMIALDGTYYFAKYSNFRIDPASDNYRLTISGHSGNATDALKYHNNQQLSTKDRDNDPYPSNCASSFKGGWWYNQCFHGNMNGVYGLPYPKGITWRDASKGFIQMSFTEMKFRNRM